VFSAPQLNALDTSQGIVFTISSNVVTISNLKEHPAGSPFRVIVDGVKNPDLISQVTTGWSVLAYYQNIAYVINYSNPNLLKDLSKYIIVLIIGSSFTSYTTGTAF